MIDNPLPLLVEVKECHNETFALFVVIIVVIISVCNVTMNNGLYSPAEEEDYHA